MEGHGGTLEKFIGDAMMAVFGVPVLHEDDAWRAACAAVALVEAMAPLNEELETEYGTQLALRIGINTGEVVTGTEERLVAGDAVNLAARLEQAAGPGEILLGAETFTIVRRAVVAEAMGPLELKGKLAPVPAWRLVSVQDGTPRELRQDVPMVGRRAELTRLLDTFERVQHDRSCALVTIVGAAGVGKSRLAAEFVDSVDGPAVVRGRCVSYGEGITYWPVVPVLRQLEPRFPSLSLDERVLATLHGLLGSEETTDSTEEIAFSVRRLLEAAAREQPLVCVFDDIQWGEPVFLELIEQVTALSRDAPLLLCCIARDDLLERHPGWGGGHLNTTTITLEGLSRDETDTLIDYITGDTPPPLSLRERIRETAEGNPLFVEEMMGLLRDAPEGDVSVPSTIQSLLASRLDQLEPAERAVLQCGAIGGRTFHRGAVQMLAHEETQLGSCLAALVRKELIRPDTPQFAGEEAYRFRHLLIRDAAYETLPKASRAELHERFADWLGPHASALVEPDEVLGYHLEQAYGYRLQLWPLDERARDIGRRASELLAAVGTRALGRGDVGAASRLLGRALVLCPEEDPAVALRLDSSLALFLSGEFSAAGELAIDAATRAAAADDHPGELRSRLAAARIAVQMPREDAAEEPSVELLALAARARPVFTRAGDEVGLTDAWVATAWAELIRCRWAAMLEAVEHALVHARRAGYVRLERELPAWKGTALFYGPTPVGDVLAWHEQAQPQHTMALNERAVLQAMQCRFGEARALLAEAEARATELGETVWSAGGRMSAWEVETLARDAAAAARAARRACELLEQLGDTAFLPSAAGQLAASLYSLDQHDEADHWAQTAEDLASGDDVVSQMLWRQVRAKLLARGGSFADAERLAGEAVGLGDGTDMLNARANALVDLAEVCALTGRAEDWHARLQQALGLYEQKGNLASAASARARLAELRTTQPLVTGPATD